MKSLILGALMTGLVFGASAKVGETASRTVKNQIETNLSTPELKANDIVHAQAKVFFRIGERGMVEVLNVMSGERYIQDFLTAQLNGMTVAAGDDLRGKVLSMTFSFRVE